MKLFNFVSYIMLGIDTHVYTSRMSIRGFLWGGERSTCSGIKSKPLTGKSTYQRKSTCLHQGKQQKKEKKGFKKV